MLRKIFVLFMMLFVATQVFCEIKMPNIHSSVVLDAKFYGGENSNTGAYDQDNRFQIRKAAVTLEGEFGDYIAYDMEFGVSTCVGKGSELKITEAGIDYSLLEDLTLSIKQGSVLRGFASNVECQERITLEKPIFLKTFGACHPFGFVANYFYKISDKSDIEVEISFMNGAGGTLNKEYDYNFGAIYSTPITGLGVSGSYTMIKSDNFYDENFKQFSDTGYRYNFGIQYDDYNILMTAEYYSGKAFTGNEQEMDAYYIQSGYSIPVDTPRLQYVQPYVMYEFWNKDKDEDQEYTYINAGVNFGLSENLRLRLNYQKELSQPDDHQEAPYSFVARLQISI